MRKLTENDLANITGSTVEGYVVKAVRVKNGTFTDSDHYGILLGKNTDGNYVTWQWHLLEDETVSAYWGHYHGEDREAALRDYETRDMDAQTFKVTITETLQQVVAITARNPSEAEDMVQIKWNNQDHVLDADNFVGVEFKAVPASCQ